MKQFVTLLSLILLQIHESFENWEWESRDLHPERVIDAKTLSLHFNKHETLRFIYHPKSTDSVLRVSISPCGATIKWTLTKETIDLSEEILFRDVNNEMMFYKDMNFDAKNIRTLYLYVKPTSNSKHCQKRSINTELFITGDTGRWLAYFPHLKSMDVKLLKFASTSAKIKFTPAKSADVYGRWTQMKYCYTLSPYRFVHTFCEWKSMGLHPNCTEELHDDRMSLNESETEYHFSQEVSMCIKHTPTVTLTHLIPDTEYMLSLFVISSRTGASLTYQGLQFKTDSAIGGVLEEGHVHAAYINPSRGSFQMFKAPITQSIPQLYLIVQPCAQMIRVHIYKNGRIIIKKLTNELYRFTSSELMNVDEKSDIKIKVINNDNEAVVFKLWISPYETDDPFPRLPIDTSLQNVDELRTCDHITLQWLKSQQTVKYCLYKKMEREDFFKKLILQRPSVCQSQPLSSELVKCIHSSELEENYLDIAETTVYDLEAATTYRFDIFVTRTNVHNAQTMSYRTLWVKTKKIC